LINKIAAGEVVERPASVVKELVENSLDAGANRIEIIIEKSGAKLLKIVDNGCGFAEDQIEVAFSRHATSKISEFKDLDCITSYGFRGEALPSIASVSRLRMVSRPADADNGPEIIIEGGVLQSRQPIAAPPGTSIEIADIFYNTPARRKFLKAETTEARHISRVAMAMAMARFDVGFTYHLNGRKVFATPSNQELGERVATLLAPGKQFVEISGEVGPLKVHGFVGMPDMVQTNRTGQYIFINGRWIQSPVLSHAFVAGYGELLPKGNFPIGALLLTIDLDQVDINVHPAKTEVRLSRERDIHDTLRRLVWDALRKKGLAPVLTVPSHGAKAGKTDFAQQNPQQSIRIPGITQAPTPNTELLGNLYNPARPATSADSPETVRVDTSTGEIISDIEMSSPPGALTAETQFSLIGRFAGLYLLLQSGDELLIVDQHAAHERILYEEILRYVDRQSGVAQQLLFPVQVELNPEQMGLFEEAGSLLNASGFVAEHFGGNTVRIEAVPSVLARKAPEKTLLAIIDDIVSLRESGHDLKKAVAQSVACRSAVMSGDWLTDEEARALMTNLMKCENPLSCPHGRPTLIRMARSDLDKQFGRI